MPREEVLASQQRGPAPPGAGHDVRGIGDESRHPWGGGGVYWDSWWGQPRAAGQGLVGGTLVPDYPTHLSPPVPTVPPVPEGDLKWSGATVVP